MAKPFGDYYDSIFEDRLINMPEHTQLPSASFTALLEKRQELAEVEASLVTQKEEFQVKFTLLQQRREDLNKKEEELKLSIIKFDKFLEFQDMNMVRTRFETLFITYDLLIAKYQEDQEIMKTLKSDHNQFMKKKNNEIMMFHNSMAKLQARRENAKTKIIKGESTWVHIQNTAAKRTIILGMTKMAIFNLYMHVRKADRQLGPASDDTDIQLQAVQQYILELSDMVRELKKSLAFNTPITPPL
ncbi:coiled-coil domain-containing protein 42 homolog isoform X4 [Scyliorhinus torazame]|uniref:coiled-coil domain-containing protein 42 homolog isoform X4 n=1 Tax=Scyliorhinus torazame TaxID=75743 RepID=UPI003B5A6B93